MMKRLILILILAAAGASASAQNYIVVQSEKIFNSIDGYNEAIEHLDKLAESYQQQVDEKFAEVEQLYNAYVARRASLSASARQVQENNILEREQQANEFQTSIFGPEGTLMKKRIELIQPIQKRVFDAIELYARQNGFDLVLDATNNPTLLYNSAAVDRTQELIELLK